MGWADRYIEKLKNGAVSFHPRGKSMEPRIMDGQMVTVYPTYGNPGLYVDVGDVVLCKVNGKQYLHLVKGMRGAPGEEEFQIGNNKGHINGWTRTIYGLVR